MKLIQLENMLYKATKSLIVRLSSEFKQHHFYYVALVTTGEGHRPIFSAWSDELLQTEASSFEDREEIKWSYADSPLFGFCDEYFSGVELLLDNVTAECGFSEETTAALLSAMELTLKRLDIEGYFDSLNCRNKLYINAEIMPPDATNVERAYRLNPRESLDSWLREAAE
ncbi:DUF4303 domain-containing protein [Vibrio alginolyticus]|uniref:DUF4303 domain-containing protein n=1 Tax=Vibrio alginolyticus TaxID=663 RepID=UPI001BD274E6|nr:DUF4303 domain-containing protein [Vibrio alginolyticus]MBS9875965.1 DUF4303 domain-containing protein [Vibrio alginolyticus]